MAVNRVTAGALVLAASAVVGIATFEGYKKEAYIPVPGDVPTIGFGTTKGVKLGDITTPVRSLHVLLDEIENKYAAGVKKCVQAPLAQYEFAAFVSLAYNIGVNAFCKSALVKKVNALDYAGACRQILRWDKAGGKKILGLTLRRQKEYQICMGIG